MSEAIGKPPDIRCELSKPANQKCEAPAVYLMRFKFRWHDAWTRYVCESCQHRGEAEAPINSVTWPLVRDARVIAIFCGALAGALDERLRDLIDGYVSGDSQIALLDEVMRREMHEPEYRWPDEPRRGWNEVAPHEHVWLPWVSGDEERASHWRGGVLRRCPCGLFEREVGDLERVNLDDIAYRASRWGNTIQMPRTTDVDPV